MITPRPFMHQPINILAFDTSRDDASLALWANENVNSVSIPSGTGIHSQAALLVPMMKDLLSEANIDFKDLHVITTSRGPGSFTGIRVGLATAQGLLSATHADIFAPTAFEVAAFGAWTQKVADYLITITTNRGSYYCQAFDKSLELQGPASIMTEQEIEDFLVQHPHMIRVRDFPKMSAQVLILLYLYKLESNQNKHAQSVAEINQQSASSLCPYYLIDPEFTKQKSWPG